MSASNTKEQATQWVILNHTARDPDSHRLAFEAWLAEDPEHWRIYQAEERRWTALEPLRLRILQDRSRTAETLLRAAERRRRRTRWAAGIAASICVIGLSIAAAWLGPGHDLARPHPWVSYQRGTEQIDPISLEDGSIVQLQINSHIHYRLTDSTRQVALEDGEAYFDVRPGLTRPFDVQAGPVVVRAKGTAFTVRREEGGQVEAAVKRGAVEVQSADPSQVDSGKSPPSAAEVKAGEVATIGPSGQVIVDKPDPAELAKRFAWANPLHQFDGVTLADAVALFNHYNVRKLEVKDVALAQIRISGRFRLTEPDRFVDSLQRLGIGHVFAGPESLPDTRILLVRK